MAINYISNKDLLAELIVYRTAYYKAKEAGEELPQVSDPIASAILRIANKLSTSYNFVNYTYREEMISDGIIKCLDKIHLFDHTRSENPFAYITQICWNAFILRIKIEQNQSSIRAKLIREKLSSEYVQHGVDAEDADSSNAFVEFLKSNDAYIDYNQERIERSTKKQEIHPSLKHRNKTSYVTKEDDGIPDLEVEQFDLSMFENDAV